MQPWIDQIHKFQSEMTIQHNPITLSVHTFQRLSFIQYIFRKWLRCEFLEFTACDLRENGINNFSSTPFLIFWIRFCFKTHWSTTIHFRSECRSNLKWSKMAATESISDSLESMEVILRYFRLRRSSGISFDFSPSSRPIVVFILRFRIIWWIADTVKYGQRESIHSIHSLGQILAVRDFDSVLKAFAVERE